MHMSHQWRVSRHIDDVSDIPVHPSTLSRDIETYTKAHSWMILSANNLYEAVGSHSYREQRYGDYYQGINFGLIQVDPVLASSVQKIDKDTKYLLTLKIMNHLGGTVRTRTIELQPIPQIDRTQIHEINSNIMRLISLPYHDFEEELIHQSSGRWYRYALHLDPHGLCHPLSGPIPIWRKLTFHVLVTLFLLFGIFIPGLYCIWLVGASVWCISNDMKQRQSATVPATSSAKKSN